jgi:hypothetical protein
MLKRLVKQPRTLFLIDGVGAFTTAFCLAVVLRTYEAYFGVPEPVLVGLSFMAILFGICSMACYFLAKKKNWKRYLQTIGTANLVYCGLTASVVVCLYDELKMLGVIYFLVEIVIIASLAVLEWKVSVTTNY